MVDLPPQSRAPGPLGATPGSGGTRSPGPLGFTPGIYLAPAQSAGLAKLSGSAKQFRMPPPASDDITKLARNVKWTLFTGKGTPALEDVKQGSLANCPLASLLAALAFTATGQRHLLSLITEHKATVETDLSGVADQLAEKIDRIITGRYFTVRLKSQSFEVSSVLYTDEARDPNPIYMTSPKQALWPCLIERAFAEKVGSYNELDDPNKLTANAVWEVVVGSSPDGFAVTGQTPDSTIQEAARNARRLPAIAASKEEAADVTAWHGFAVLGMRGTRIELYDPSSARRETLSLAAFRKNFLAVLHGKG